MVLPDHDAWLAAAEKRLRALREELPQLVATGQSHTLRVDAVAAWEARAADVIGNILGADVRAAFASAEMPRGVQERADRRDALLYALEQDLRRNSTHYYERSRPPEEPDEGPKGYLWKLLSHLPPRTRAAFKVTTGVLALALLIWAGLGSAVHTEILKLLGRETASGPLAREKKRTDDVERPAGRTTATTTTATASNGTSPTTTDVDDGDTAPTGTVHTGGPIVVTTSTAEKLDTAPAPQPPPQDVLAEYIQFVGIGPETRLLDLLPRFSKRSLHADGARRNIWKLGDFLLITVDDTEGPNQDRIYVAEVSVESIDQAAAARELDAKRLWPLGEYRHRVTDRPPFVSPVVTSTKTSTFQTTVAPHGLLQVELIWADTKAVCTGIRVTWPRASSGALGSE